MRAREGEGEREVERERKKERERMSERKRKRERERALMRERITLIRRDPRSRSTLTGKNKDTEERTIYPDELLLRVDGNRSDGTKEREGREEGKKKRDGGVEGGTGKRRKTMKKVL